MVFKVPTPENQEELESPRFKLKRSWREIEIARKLLDEESTAATGSDEDEALSVEEAFQTAQDIIRFEVDEDRYISRYFYPSPSTSRKEEPRTEFDFPHASIFNHPWHIIDYHLYLCAVEKNKDLRSRRNGMHLFDGDDCRPFPYHEFHSDRNLVSTCDGPEGTRLLFSALPIADRTHFADRNPSFAGGHYVLGFDLTDKVFYARWFSWIPEQMNDLCCFWEEGTDVYSVSIEDLACLLRSTIDEGETHVGMGILSASPFCIALSSSDDPGLEIIIVIAFCQWLLDFSEIIFDQKAPSLVGFKKHLVRYIEECRLILQRASYRAWFAARDGISKQKYKHSSTLNQYINDLYTYEKSVQAGSLDGRPWHAPGQDTCNRIRMKDRMTRKEETERRLMDLFIPPVSELEKREEEAEEAPVSEKEGGEQGDAEKNEVQRLDEEKSEDNLIFYTPPHSLYSGTPRTPSPRIEQTPPLSPRSLSPGSPAIVTPANMRYDNLEITEYHNIPLSLLLRRALDLVEARPQLDTFDNRGQFGALLTGIGVGVENLPVDDNEIAPRMGYQNDGWKLETRASTRQETPIVRRLLPSPVID